MKAASELVEVVEPVLEGAGRDRPDHEGEHHEREYGERNPVRKMLRSG